MSTENNILPMEKRQKIHRKAQSKCAELCREVGAKFAYAVVLIEGSGGVHMVDAASGELIPDMGSFLRSVAAAHDNQDTHVGGDVGYRQ